MKRTGSVLCPSCGTLVGVNDAQCLTCGRRNPGLWGFTAVLRTLGDDMGFVNLVLWACGALYLASLAADVSGIRMDGLLSMLSPSIQSLFLFGASGSVPVFRFGRWWTVLSATWLHGGLLHILFNMMWVRQLGPAAAEVVGPARTVIIYTVAGVTGFLLSSVAGVVFAGLPIPILHGASFTIGASASIFGLLGALVHYGRSSGSSLIRGEA